MDKYWLVQTNRTPKIKFPGQEVLSDYGVPLFVLCSLEEYGNPGNLPRVEV